MKYLYQWCQSYRCRLLSLICKRLVDSPDTAVDKPMRPRSRKHRKPRI